MTGRRRAGERGLAPPLLPALAWRVDNQREEGSVSQEEGSLSREEGSLSREEGSLSREEGSLSREEGSVSREEGSLSREQVDVRAVLLDVDGTLIDSNDAHARAWVDTGREFGHAIEFDEVRRMIGMGGDKVLPRLVGLEEDDEEGERMLERRGEIFRERYLSGLRAFPGAVDLVKRLRADGKTLVVATSASEEDLGPLLKQAGLEDLLDLATNSDDADESKPSPDIVEAALEKADEHPSHVVMIGDTPYDVEAAQRAGIRIIGVECGGWTTAELHGAREVYADPAELLRRYEDSLLGR
jgi:HAD superfamily hydrolase (TIGR01549 family)